MGKGVIFATKSCLRSICNHPFIVAMLCFLILLHRASPWIFSLLVSASPVVVCTLLLLGTLLSFGQLNIPEIPIEEKSNHETVSIKTAVSKNAASSDNESLYGERYSENQTSEADKSKVVEDCVDDSITKISAALIDKRPVEIGSGTEEIRNDGLSGHRYEDKNKSQEEGLSDLESVENYSVASVKIKHENLESETEKSEADSFDSERVNVDSLDSPPRSPWRRVGDCNDEEDEEHDDDDDALDSGSDGSESSSPDASMADIMPMLDELHPLLDEDIPQPIQTSRGGSDAGSEMSSKSSSSSSHESDDDDDEIENDINVEVADNDNDDGDDEEEEIQGDKESGIKSAITWTEEDQKNLMDLGSSELERNQRLETLILRRRARKNLSMVPERNLIDFESNDFQFHVAPITTMRLNPFDLLNDAHDNSGLPPIPGSAPSILVPKRNPFDIPYDSSEEKPNLSNDGFQEEFATFQSREPFFRRHESFNVGPSTFSHGRQDVRFRPYFIPERSIPEESNYSPYQRNSSELSDSKVSSVTETESIGSVENLEDQKFTEEENKQELGAISADKEEICEDTELIIERERTEEDITHETETISEIKHVSEEDVGHGSQSSEEDEKVESLESGESGKRDDESDNLQFQSPEAQDHYEEEEESVVPHVQDKASSYESGTEDVELRYNRNSTSSSSSEVSERVFNETEGEGLSISEERHNDIAHERHFSTQTSIGSTDLLADDVPHKEPVYDSSPSAVGTNLSYSSICSDAHVESDPCFPPVLVKRTVSFVESEDVPKNIEMLPETSDDLSTDEHELQRKDIVSISEQHVARSDLAGANLIQQGYKNEDASEADQRLDSREASAYSLEENSNSRDQIIEVPSSSSQQNNQVLGQSSDERGEVQLDEEMHLVVCEQEKRVLVNMPAFNRPIETRCSTEKEENVASPSSDVDVYHEANEKLISTPSADGGTPLFYDVVMHEPFKHLEEVQVPNTPVGSFEELRTITNLAIPHLQLLSREMSTSIDSPRSPDFVSMVSSASGEASSHIDLETIIEEAYEIKEIDEGILSELDSVSDFNITQQGSDSNVLDKHVHSVGESPSAPHDSVSSSTEVVITYQETSQNGMVERDDTSDHEFSDRNGQGSPDHVRPHSETLTNNIESDPGDSAESQNLQEKIPEIEVETVKDNDVAVISEKEIKEPVVSESVQSEVIVCETVAERSEEERHLVNTSTIESIDEMQIIEGRPVEDSTSDLKQIKDDSRGSSQIPDSGDQIHHEENSQEVQLTAESHATEAISREDEPSKQVLDEQRNPTNNVKSIEDNVGLTSSSAQTETDVKEISLNVSEKSVQEVRVKHSAKANKGKRKLSKSSSSSSSSSSESSSSDSD